MPTIGLDIGGANLKASNGRSRSLSRPFAIWKEPERLAVELRELLQDFVGASRGQGSGIRSQREQDSFSPSPPLGTGDIEEQLQRGGEGWGEGHTPSVRNLNPSPQPSPPHPMQHREESRLRGRGSEEESGVKPQATSLTSIAVTMTAELADCFATKAEGVHFILDAVAEVAGGRDVLVWQTGGEFVSIDEARELVPLVAAANWHALATWAARMTLGADAASALLIDLGSTTCDIIPLVGGLPMPTGRTDVERLMSRELVYTGVRRTPVMAVSPSVPFRGESVPLAAELFATMLDVYLLTGEIAEDADDTNTANGRPATVDAAWDRIARSLCCDRSECTLKKPVRSHIICGPCSICRLCRRLSKSHLT